MGTRRLTQGTAASRWIAVAVGILIVVAGATRYLQARDLRAAVSRSAATDLAATLSVEILGRFHELVLAATTASDPGIRLERVHIEGGRLVGGQVMRSTSADNAARLLDAVSTSRDLDAAQLVVLGASNEDVGRAIVVLPSFTVADPLATTAQRRRAFRGADLALLDLDDIVRTIPDPADLAVTVFIDGVPLVSRGTPGDVEVGDARASVLGRTLAIRATTSSDVPFGVGMPGLVGGMAFAALAFQLLRVAGRRAERAEAERDGAAAERALILDIGRMLQASLDLAETMPGIALRLCEEFRLEAVTLIESKPGKAPTPIFSHGEPKRRDADGTKIPLGKAGRQLGALVVHTTVEIPADQMRALETVCGLLAAALANSYLIEAERAVVEELNRVNSMKTDFLATVSHEVRTPLASIIGFAALLREPWDRYTEEQVRDFVSRIDLNAVTLSAMLTDILDFSRLERGALKIVPAEVDVAAALDSVVRRNAPIFAERIVTLDVPDELEAWADRAALEQVVSNLLTNAVKFSPERSRILIRGERVDGCVRVSVEDEGPGVVPSERERIFDRFYRGSSDLARTTRGAGIGLSVVSDLLKQMGASIGVTEAPSGGAVFTIELRGTEPVNTTPITSDVRSMT